MTLNGYTNIPDWMLSYDLDVYETIILAVIFGFSQDGESTFTGSQKYLADKAKCSKRKVATALSSLVEKGLIKKIDKDVRGIHLCEYYCTMCKGIAPCAWGDAPGATNNIDNNIDRNINISILPNKGRAQKFVKPSIEEVTAYCTERGNKVNAEAFVAFYESKGWKVGNSPMRDWQAAVRTWEQRVSETQTAKAPSSGRKESVYERNRRMAEELFGKGKEGNIDEQ